MLVLSRRTDEEIVIDGHIRIRVLASSGGKVRLGISAPREVPVERGELAGTRTIECLTPPRRDGLLFDLRGAAGQPRCAEPLAITTEEREFSSLPA